MTRVPVSDTSGCNSVRSNSGRDSDAGPLAMSASRLATMASTSAAVNKRRLRTARRYVAMGSPGTDAVRSGVAVAISVMSVYLAGAAGVVQKAPVLSRSRNWP